MDIIAIKFNFEQKTQQEIAEVEKEGFSWNTVPPHIMCAVNKSLVGY